MPIGASTPYFVYTYCSYIVASYPYYKNHLPTYQPYLIHVIVNNDDFVLPKTTNHFHIINSSMQLSIYKDSTGWYTCCSVF